MKTIKEIEDQIKRVDRLHVKDFGELYDVGYKAALRWMLEGENPNIEAAREEMRKETV